MSEINPDFDNPHASPVPVEMIEKAARAICMANGYKPDGDEETGLPYWETYVEDAEAGLTAAGVPELIEENHAAIAKIDEIIRQAEIAFDGVHGQRNLPIIRLAMEAKAHLQEQALIPPTEKEGT